MESLPLILSLTALVIILTIFFFFFFFFFFKTRSKPENKLPPGSNGWPFLGETIDFIRTRVAGSPEKFVGDRVEKYRSPIFRTSLLGESVVVLHGAAGNKLLFSNENKLVAVWWPASVKKLLGDCISTTVGIEGLLMRKMVSYFVSPDAFTKLYIQTMDTVSQQHINTHWQEGLKVFPAIKLYTFELACRLFMSIEDPTQIKWLASLFNVFLTGVISIPIDFPGTKFYKARRATAAIKKELLMIVRQRREELERETAAPLQDLMTHLLASPDENGKFMSESVVVNNVFLLLFAGHDTSSCAITMLMKALADHPQVYERVLREQKEISSSKRAGEYLQWEDIQKMKYSWNVVSETMRLWPPVAGCFREALVDFNYGGYHIPKGWKFLINVPSAHTDCSSFPESSKFDPSRFEGAGPVPYTYVPFGGGPRMCLGKEFARLEILTFLHNVVGRFRWSLVIPSEKVRYDPIPTPEEGLPVHLHPHQHPFSP